MFDGILESQNYNDFSFKSIRSVEIKKINVELTRPFEISGGSVDNFEPILIKIIDIDGNEGISTLDNFSTSVYDGNGTTVSWYALKEYLTRLIQNINKKKDFSIFDIQDCLHNIRDHNNFAVSSIEMAFWDLLGKKNNIPCYTLFYSLFKDFLQKMQNNPRFNTIINNNLDFKSLDEIQTHNIEDGLKSKISIGLQMNFCEYLRIIDEAKSNGIDAIKLKITPQKKYNYNIVKYIREYYPDLHIDTDSNSSFIPQRDIFGKPDLIPLIKTFSSMKPFNIRMHEQPSIFHNDHLEILSNIISKSQQSFCLDESIHSPLDVFKFTELQPEAKQNHYINIKIHRTGGILSSLWILAFLKYYNFNPKLSFKLIPWGGYMPDQEISTNALLHLFSMPVETSHTDATDHSYWFKYSIFDKTMNVHDGNIKIIQGNGFGLEIDEDIVKNYLIKEKKIFP